MCIVIDINALAMVFDEKNARHAEYTPIKQWIEEGNGFLIFGGTKYKAELAKTGRYMRLLRQMRDGGKAIAIKDSAVDALEEIVQQKTTGTQCDDQHIVALLGASRCKLLCSFDSRSFDFIKDFNLYPKGVPRVKIYTSARNKKLLKKSDPRKLTNVKC